MTQDEAKAEMRRLSTKRNALVGRIAEAARAVVPVLLDAGRNNSAKNLQELFFELEVCDQGMSDFVKSDPKAAMDGLLALMEH